MDRRYASVPALKGQFGSMGFPLHWRKSCRGKWKKNDIVAKHHVQDCSKLVVVLSTNETREGRRLMKRTKRKGSGTEIGELLAVTVSAAAMN